MNDVWYTKVWWSGIGNIIYVFIRILEVPLSQSDSDGHYMMAHCSLTLRPLVRLAIALLMQDVVGPDGRCCRADAGSKCQYCEEAHTVIRAWWGCKLWNYLAREAHILRLLQSPCNTGSNAGLQNINFLVGQEIRFTVHLEIHRARLHGWNAESRREDGDVSCPKKSSCRLEACRLLYDLIAMLFCSRTLRAGELFSLSMRGFGAIFDLNVISYIKPKCLGVAQISWRLSERAAVFENDLGSSCWSAEFKPSYKHNIWWLEISQDSWDWHNWNGIL